jgi:hypothetical protein
LPGQVDVIPVLEKIRDSVTFKALTNAPRRSHPMDIDTVPDEFIL